MKPLAITSEDEVNTQDGTKGIQGILVLDGGVESLTHPRSLQ